MPDLLSIRFPDHENPLESLRRRYGKKTPNKGIDPNQQASLVGLIGEIIWLPFSKAVINALCDGYNGFPPRRYGSQEAYCKLVFDRGRLLRCRSIFHRKPTPNMSR